VLLTFKGAAVNMAVHLVSRKHGEFLDYSSDY